jgi:glyoxylase-like metal-dependent hydrolase (beta-lactamase superfamily II)
MRVADNVEILEIGDGGNTLCLTLTWGGGEVVLIDAGLPGQLDLIREAVMKAGFDLKDITKVIITHQDMDHIGCAKLLSELGAEILAHEEEAPYIQGDVTSVRLADMEKRRSGFSAGEREYYEKVKANAKNFYVHVDRLLKDGEILDLCGGIKVIHTPGHMPGHIALLMTESNILVAGDAANASDGKLTGANPQYSQDMALADISFKKMMAEKPDSVICYHGGLCSNRF